MNGCVKGWKDERMNEQKRWRCTVVQFYKHSGFLPDSITNQIKWSRCPHRPTLRTRCPRAPVCTPSLWPLGVTLCAVQMQRSAFSPSSSIFIISIQILILSIQWCCSTVLHFQSSTEQLLLHLLQVYIVFYLWSIPSVLSIVPYYCCCSDKKRDKYTLTFRLL